MRTMPIYTSVAGTVLKGIAIKMGFQKNILLGTVFLVGCLSTVIGQNFLNGKVVETGDGGEEELAGASLFWLGTTSGTLSDKSGNFSLERMPGQDKLVVRFDAFSDTLEVAASIDFFEVRLNITSDIKDLRIGDVVIQDRIKSSGFSRLDPKGTELIRDAEFRKAACCNLSESFETNPSVDASFTDAVTGTRQIRMLGLSGAYVALTSENMPLMSGLASINGLSHIPSAWVSTIQLSKGTGSVVNGFEGIAGQINVNHYLPDEEEALILNGFGNIGGRMEGNAVYNAEISKVVGTSIFAHAAVVNRLNDRNKDGFLDMPLRQNLSFMNRWKFNGTRGIMGQVNIVANRVRNRSGQVNHYSKEPVPSIPYYNFQNFTDRYQAFAKMGYLSPKDNLTSIGSQIMILHHDESAAFGQRSLDSRQNAFYGNLIFQFPLAGDTHLLKTGLSTRIDDFRENIQWSSLDSADYSRREQVSGLFAEYTYEPSEKMTLVLGLRGDIHNYYGSFMTPRVHFRYALTPVTSIRLSAGRGQRSPNVLTDQLGLLASSRTWYFSNTTPGLPGYGLLPEIGWNIGGSLTQEFFLDYREGYVKVDFFRTQFTQQVVIDRETPEALTVYPLDGVSFANSFLVEASYELIKRLDLRLAYRFYDVRTKFRTGLLLQPFNPRHRGFANLSFKTRKNGFAFDCTFQYVGPQRIPGESDSPAFVMVNGQVNKEIGKSLEIYIGGENLLDYRQDNPIVNAQNPFAPDFDATMIWGPVFGRNAYAGFRLKLKRK